ncbi:MAG TPA: lamin tail domain-containing protein, partial [Kiritimatiellia bacterium]|nr:lamin tail domain-containing protein [Kiritimatiellia bacterium]
MTAQGSAAVTNRGVCYKTSAGVAITDNKTQSGSGTGAFSVNLSSLSVNTKYYFKAYAINTAGTTLGSELSFTTLANTPSAPTVNNPTASSLDITINENSNPAATEFAIQRTSDSNYLQANGSWGASAVWQNKATWGSPKTATGLSAATTYSIRVKARNGENVETAFSSTADGTTCFDSVTGVYVNPTNETNFTINWSAVSGADGYVVDVSTEEDFGGGGGGSTNNIFISEMCDPQNNYTSDRYIEIFNAGSASVDLTGWSVVAVGNSSDIHTWTLSGTIGSSNALTCGDSSNTQFTPDFSDSSWSSDNTSWNGKVGDGARLVRSGTTIDNTKTTADAFENKTYVRNAGIGTGVTTYASGEWSATAVSDAGSGASTPGSHDCTSVPSGGSGGGGLNCIPGYTNREVASTSLSVTGLTGGVTYYFRVTATNANCSATSSTGSVTTTSAATSPEIAVLGTNLAEIVSGDNSPAVSDGTDFQLWEASTTHDHIFTITNSGNDTLTLSGQPTLSGDAAFSRQANVGDLTLAPGQAETFTIRFTAPSNPGGVYTSLVTVASDDTDEGTYTFAIRAEVHCFTEVTGVYASQTNAQDFTAAWSAVTGADGYILDVATNADFSSAGGSASDLFISEYIEYGNEKYIEIYNGTGGSVDLSNYALVLYANGATSHTASNTLSGTLADGDVVVYKNSSSTNTVGTDSSSVNYNGDDAVALWKSTSSSWVDIFGRIGEDPGAQWTDGSFSTADATLVRKSTVTGGVTSNPGSGFPTLGTEWDLYDATDESHLDDHTFSGGSGGSMVPGFDDLPVSGTSQIVTGLTQGITYYFRVMATNENCESSWSSTQQVTTVVSADTAGPTFSNFAVTNSTGTVVLDRHFSGFPIFVDIADSTTGVRWTTATQPFFTITNPSNSEVVGPTTFTTTGHADRETACTATGTVPDIASSFVAGTWKVGVWAEDMNDYAGSDTFTFTAADDDDAYPNIYSVHLSSTDEGADAVGSGALLAGTGWWLTGMVNDAGSGVDTNSFPGYFLLYDFNGDLQYSNQMIMKFDDGAATVQGQIQHSALSGLSSAPAGVWTARVYVTDNDADGWTGDSLTSVSNIPFTVVYSCPAGPGTLWADPTNVFDYTANWSAVGGVSDYIINVYSNYAAADELFFSEYIEGSGYNKYLEIYNGTGSDVDLSDYVIHQFNGGSPTPSFTMTLTGTLADGDVYVIANDSASAWGGSPDLVTNSSVMAFNGDDALALSNTALNTYCDIIGQIGTDPGTEWGSGDTSTSDNTIRRKSSVTEGDTDGTDAFDPATEWDGYAQDTVSDLGSHTVSGGSGTSEWVPGFSNLLVSSSTSQSITGLVPNTPYYFEVASIGADCTGSFSAVETVYTRPVMDPTAASATADGNTLIDLAWTKHASYNVMIVHRIGSASTVPTQGAAYSVNDACGGGTVIYKGSGAALEHVVPSAATHHYAFYSYSGNYYSTGVTASASTGAFLPGEIVETFSYTNSTALTGLNGSNLWGGAWYGDTGLFTNSSGSFAEQAVYPAPTGNKLLVTPANDANVAVFRPLGRDYNEGRIYFSYIMNYQCNGPDKYAGLSFFYTNSSEKLFIGEIGSADTTLGIDSTSSSYTLTQGSGNDYIIVGYYDWGDAEAKVKAYKIGTQSVPSEEPLVWDATVSKASNTVGVINNIRLAAGEFGGGSGTPGNCYFDEVRIATNWFELVQTTPSKIIYDGFGGTDPNSLSGWAGGTGWSDTWALGGDPYVNFSSGSIDDGYSSYYIPTGEKIVMYGNADGRYVTATRTFNQTFTGGQVYFSWMQNYEFNGSGKWAGMKILDSGTEKAFIGKISGADKALGIDDSTHNITSAVVNLENGAGNDYIIVAKYDFDTRELAATSYKVTSDGNCEMVAEEPNGYWQLTTTQSVGHISSLTGVRLHIGGGMGVQIGDVYMDEVRVGTNWYEVTRQDGETNAAVMAAGPVPTLVYIGTDTVVNGLANLNHDDSDITVSDAELIDETAPLSIAVSWYDPNGVFLTNSTASITNIGSRAGRVNPNWDPALLEGSDLQAVGYDGLFDIFYGDNGDLSVTTGIDNAFSITNDASTSSTYYMTVSAEDDNQTGGTLTAPNGGDDVPIWRAITVNSNLTFYVGDDDTTGPTISDFIVGGSGSGGCSGGGLFISEVADPSDTANARFVELFNATGADIDFGSATWYLSRQANGSSWVDHQLTGIITNGDTFVIAYNATFDTKYGFAANNYDGLLITGNGNDGYFLYSGGNHSAGTLVDAYGVVDVDGTSEPWEYEDSHAVRNPDILKGTNVWTASQWTISAAAVANMHPNNHTNNCSGGGASEVTDGQILNGGYGVTVTVADAKSGVLVSNLVANYYLLWNEDSVLACSNFFLTPFTNASLGPVTMVTTGGPAFSSAVVTLGEYTGVVVAADADDDRDGDYTLNTSAAITFTVIDDDTNAPAASDFRIEDSGTTWDSRGDLILTGIVTDVSGVDTGSMYFLMYDEDEVLIWSNSFVISGNADDEYWVSSTSSGPNVDDMCGGIFTINVVAVDGDLDRGVEDTLGTTNFNALTVSVIGEGGAPPAVTNLKVADEEIVDESSLELTDEDINTGGYNLSMILTHEDGLYIGGGTPAFIMYNDFGTEIMNEPFTNIVDVVEGAYTAYYATNLALPGVAAANVDLGQYSVTWSASNQGACIAVEIDSGLITGGTNVFTVVDDDADEPEVDAFAAAGQPAGVSTVSEEDAAAGFSITGLVRDVLSGIDITTAPPTYTIYNPATGTPMGGYENVEFDDLGFGQGEATDYEAIGATSITLPGSCGVIYTVVVSVADADADRATGDQSSLTDQEVLVIQIEGETGGSLDADGLFVNKDPVEDSNSATVYDDEFVAGSWTMSFAVASTDIEIEGPNKPTFTFYDESEVYVYGGEWETITEAGGKIYATNAPMDPSPNTNFSLGAYRVYWSGRETGLCYATATESGNFGAAYTNIINVADDDPTYPVIIDNFSVAGGAVTGGVGFIGCDDSRTNLVAGDIAIIGMNTYTKNSPAFVNQDSFAFVATVGIPAGTEIKFTDNGWHCGALYGNEGTITWISTNCVEPGTVIIYKKYSDPYDSGSSATVNIGQLIDDPMFSVNIRNEEILAYQGDASDPTFLYALDTSITVPGVWEDCPLPTSDKAIRTSLPPGLQNGLTAVCVSNYDDVVLNTNTTAILGDRQTVLEYIGDYHNWIGHDTIVFPLDTWDFTFPELGSVGGTVTDEDILNGTWDITGQVYDVDSGLSQDSVWYMAFNTSGVAFISAGYFTNAWENPLTATQNLNISTVEEANSYENVTIGTNNYVTIAAMDVDADRGSDSLTEYLDIPFTVVDDDINPPFFDYLTWNGGTSLDTNQALAGDISVTARVNDIQSGIAFETAPPYILV